MTHQARAERTIPVSPDTLWGTVSAMTGMEEWYPGLIAKSDVPDPDANQPRRVCTMQDGGTLRERILLRDAATRTFVYAIDESPMPARDVVGVIRIDDLGDGRSHVTWSSEMTLDEATAAQFVPMVDGMYAAGLAALEEHHAA
jgi:mxaD protein